MYARTVERGGGRERVGERGKGREEDRAMCVCIYRRVETELNAILWCIHVCVSVPGPSRGTRVYLRALTRAYTLRLGCLRTPAGR